MNQSDDWLRRLNPPRRNHFFTGKMMGVAQFEREQRYGVGQSWLMNRLTLGTGILCGLEADASDGKVLFKPGVAVDPLGREVVVAQPFAFDPFKPHAACGCGGSAIPNQAGSYHLCVSYHECATDAVPIPQSADCAGVEECQADTTVESFIPSLVPVNTELALPFSCGWLEPLKSGDPPRTADLRQRLATMLKARCAPPAGVCVVLGTAVLSGSPGALSIQSLTSDGRMHLYSQAELLEMILCLAQQLAECCGEPPPTPPPTVPTLRIVGLEFMTGQRPLEKLAQREPPPKFGVGRELTGFRVAFSAAVNQRSVEAGGVLVTQVTRAGAVPFPGTFDWISDRAFVFRANGVFPVGDYAVVLFGDPGAGGVITSMESTPRRLNGEPRDLIPNPLNPSLDALPSGNDTEGGNFDFRFSVTAP